MTKPDLKLIVGDRYDIATSAAALCAEFKLGVEAEQRVADCLAYIDARRFAVPYDEGLQLALVRPFGAELRDLVAQPFLTAEKLYSMDHHTCDEAGMLELTDRLGSAQLTVALELYALTNYSLDVMPFGTRMDPLSFRDVMPLMREALGRIYNDLTGAKPDGRRDFSKKMGIVVPTPDRMGAFICRGLLLAGWTFKASHVAYNYKATLAPPLFPRVIRGNASGVAP